MGPIFAVTIAPPSLFRSIDSSTEVIPTLSHLTFIRLGGVLLNTPLESRSDDSMIFYLTSLRWEKGKI